jgi:RNA polymerase sigma-70 factor (ECF subfamily)
MWQERLLAPHEDTPVPLTSSNSTDPTLLRDVKADDPAAKKKLVEWVGPLIAHWCRSLVRLDREEVIQEVFLQLFDSIGKYQERTGGSFRGWLRTITSSKIVDLIRRKRQEPQAAGGDKAYRALLEQAGQQLGQDDDSDANILLWRALEQIEGDFEARVWQAFWRTTADGLSAVEAGTQLGMTAEAVRRAKWRVLTRLREMFGAMLT